MIVVVVLVACLVASVIFNIKCITGMLELNDKHEELADQIESSLDVLDDCYQKIAKVAETPVASDDPVVRELLHDVQRAKDAVLLVANMIVSFDQPVDDGEAGE